MSGVTPQGFVSKSLSEILSDLDDALRAELGDSIRLDASSVLGQVRGAVAIEIAEVWQALAEIPEGFDPDVAVGAQLDAIVALVGVDPRQAASPSTGTLTLGGTPGAVIPLGAEARDPSAGGITVRTTQAGVIGALGSVDVAAESVDTGPLEAPSGSITTIVTPYAGWSTVTNAVDFTPGRDIESDLELRARREQSLQASSFGTEGAILAVVLALDEVDQAFVRSNRTTLTFADGTPPGQTRVVLYPDSGSASVEQEIAETLFANIVAGGASYGTDVTATVVDSQGTSQIVRWDYADEVNVFVDVTVTVAAGSAVAVTDVEDAVVDYINALQVGDDVRDLATRVAIQAISPTVLGASALTIDTIDPPVATGDLAIDVDEIARSVAANIGVTLVVA